jgi:uncharacterized membrane protein
LITLSLFLSIKAGKEHKKEGGSQPMSTLPVQLATDLSAQQSAQKTANVVYILQALSLFVGITLIPAILVGFVKKLETEDKQLASHFQWQLRTSWNTLFWLIVGVLLLEWVIGYFVLAWTVVWFIYRVVQGWIKLQQGKGAYQ